MKTPEELLEALIERERGEPQRRGMAAAQPATPRTLDQLMAEYAAIVKQRMADDPELERMETENTTPRPFTP